MNRQEFLKELENNLSGMDKNEKDNVISFYFDYFNKQMAEGKTQEDIINELGDPRLLAKSINENYKKTGRSYGGTVNGASDNYHKRSYRNVTIDLNSWYSKLIAIVIAILVILLVGAVIAGLLTIFLKIVVPVIVILIIVTVLENIFRK